MTQEEIDSWPWKIYLGHGKWALVDEVDILFLHYLSDWNRIKSGGILGKKGLKPSRYMNVQIAVRMGLDISMDIDHRNRDKLDNRRANLRCATKSQNSANCNMRSCTRSGFQGVYPIKGGKFHSKVTKESKTYYLGTFDTALEAHEVYKAAKLKLFGDFAP